MLQDPISRNEAPHHSERQHDWSGIPYSSKILSRYSYQLASGLHSSPLMVHAGLWQSLVLRTLQREKLKRYKAPCLQHLAWHKLHPNEWSYGIWYPALEKRLLPLMIPNQVSMRTSESSFLETPWKPEITDSWHTGSSSWAVTISISVTFPWAPLTIYWW